MTSNKSARILIADDEAAIRDSLATVLTKEGYSCKTAASGDEAIALFDEDPFDIVITDIQMPGATGIEVMRHVREKMADTIVLLITAFASLETAIEAVREGASDYLAKPVRFESVVMRVSSLLKLRDLEWENRILKLERRTTRQSGEILGESEAIEEVRVAARRFGAAPGNVLIEGESGSGKELVARAIHEASRRSAGAFLPVNCGSIPDNLLESEFFGHRKGAFTGASTDKPGLFLEARGGTLFLDEVAELPMGLQSKLLRAIETKEVRAVGAVRAVPADTRIVAATNRNLQSEVKEGRFREDLYYRLNVLQIRVPPLRERVADIPVLTGQFLHRYAGETQSPAGEISPAAMRILQGYEWRGNVRELQNILQRAVITSTRPVINSALIEQLLGIRERAPHDLRKALRQYEIAHIGRVLEEAEGEKQIAADRLGISLASLYSKLKP